MLGLKATDAVKAALRELRDANPDLFAVLSERISALREDPEPRDQGRSFRLDDGRTAHLASFFDVAAQSDLVLVWLVEEIDGEGVLTLRALEHAD